MKDFSVLIIDDDAASAMYLTEVLSEVRIQTAACENGLQALDYLKNNSVDLVLMDLKMPGMDGYETTQKIKELYGDLPVIAQTAFALQGDKEKAFDAGCNDYITKPIKMNVLMSTIEKYYSKSLK